MGTACSVTYGYDVDRGWLKSVLHSGSKFSKNLTYFDKGNIETQTIGNNTLGVNYTYTSGYVNQNRALEDAMIFGH